MTSMISLILVLMLTMGGGAAANICAGPAVSPVNAGNSSGLNLDANVNEKPLLGEISKIRLFEPMLIAQKARITSLFRIDFEKSLLVEHYYFRARHLDPIMGRFLSTDPMGYEDSLNLYQAFGMNPINFDDPFGLLTQDQRNKVRQQVFQLLMSSDEGRKNAALAALQNYRSEFGALTTEDIEDIFGENDIILNNTFVTMQDILNLGGAKIALGLEDLSTNYNIYSRDDFMGMDALALRWNTEGMIGSYNSVIGRISRMNRIRKASGSMESSYSFLNPTINRSLSYIELTPENYEEILTEQMALEGQSKAAVFATTSVACNLAVRTNIIKARENFITNAKAKYPKQFEQYSELNANQLEKAINTHSKRIAEHELFIRDPKSHVPNWESLSPKHQNNLIYHWQQDILRHSAYKAIAEAILETR